MHVSGNHQREIMKLIQRLLHIKPRRLMAKGSLVQELTGRDVLVMKKVPTMPALPSRVLGCHWPAWNGPVLSAIPSGYNTIWLFAAVPAGGPPGTTGAVTWSQHRESATQFNTDLADIRAAGRCVILSVGGEYYDLAGLFTESSKIGNGVSSIESAWLPLVNYNAAQVGLGYGLTSAVSDTMIFSSFATVWKTLVTKYPSLRGAFCWEATADHAEGWSFETTFQPLIIGD